MTRVKKKKEGRKLTDCFYSVGIIKYVKTQCTPQINAYDRCLKENTEDPRVCIPVFKDLYICTEAASVTFKEQVTKN